MKLRSLAVNQFKKFNSPMRLDGIDDGLNIVVGPNEMGEVDPARCTPRSPFRETCLKGKIHHRVTE